MRLVAIIDATVGDVIAKPIYDSKMSLLIRDGTSLSEALLKKLKEVDIRHLYIEDDISQGIMLEPLIPEILKLQSVVAMKHIYEAQAKKNEQNPEALRESTIRELKDLVDNVISEIYDRAKLKYYSTELLGVDMYHYDHSVEVMILSLLIGHQMGLDRERLLKLGMGAVLADIGKMRVPSEILNKKGKLTPEEFEEMKFHVQHSYNMLKELVGLSSLSRQIVLLHHEKLDGSGYPNGFSGEEIPLLVRIVTVCDIFCAIVSDRTYNNRISVDTALEILRSAAPLKLDSDVVHHLAQIVDVYPPGTLVELTNGSYGIVVETNYSSATRPVIRLIPDNQSVTAYETVDLMKELTLFIKKVLPKLP